MKRYLFPVCIIGLFGTFGCWHFRNHVNGETSGGGAPGSTQRSGLSPESDNSSIDVGRTRSRIRLKHQSLTIEETGELLRTTIIPLVDFPEDQSVVERVALLNKFIQEAGGESQRLRIIIGSADLGREMRFREEMKMRNAPVAMILRNLLGRTRFFSRVHENGIVELYTPIFEDAELGPSSGQADLLENDPLDPFATPDPRVRIK